jgi:hypothetical protein
VGERHWRLEAARELIACPPRTALIEHEFSGIFMIMEMSYADLLARMRNFEDHFVERKTSGDMKDFLKTIVAFANSAPIGYPAVLYLGVKNSGEIETPQVNLDNLQKTVNKELQKTYPRIPCFQKIIEHNERQALAIIILGSEKRPHFSGPSFIRTGSETLEASEQQFNELIAARNSKVSRMLAFKGKVVSVTNVHRTANHVNESNWGGTVTIYYCDQFFVTLATGPTPNERNTFPLNQVEISFDDAQNRLLLKIIR